MAPVVRLQVNISVKAAEVLSRKPPRHRFKPWKRLPDWSVTERLHRAIAMYKYFDDEAQKGNQIRVVNKRTGKVRELMFY